MLMFIYLFIFWLGKINRKTEKSTVHGLMDVLNELPWSFGKQKVKLVNDFAVERQRLIRLKVGALTSYQLKGDFL